MHAPTGYGEPNTEPDATLLASIVAFEGRCSGKLGPVPLARNWTL